MRRERFSGAPGMSQWVEGRAPPAGQSASGLRGREILLFASAPWVSESRLNCHHVAARLAAANRVLYVESPGLRTLNPLYKGDMLKIARRLRSWMRGLTCGPQRVTANLHVLSPIVLPFQARPGGARLNGILLARACGRAARRLQFRRPLLWAFLPTAVHLLARFNESVVIYHCVDDYAGNPGVNAHQIEEEERRLAGAAALCFATSRPLAGRLSGMGASVACVPNVAEVERFLARPERIAGDLHGLPRPVIGYVGNVASYKVDVGLLAEVARRRPEWSVVLVGQSGGGDPSTKLDELHSCRNVHILGPRPYESIPAYVHGFDVCLIPFRWNRVTEGSLPLKTFEYLAAGKPVVATPLASLKSEPLGQIIEYASNAEGFIQAIEACLTKDDEQSRAARREVAGRYSWRRRFPEIESSVLKVLKGTQSGEAP